MSAILESFQQRKRSWEFLRLLNVPRQTVSDVICCFKELGNDGRHPGSGQKRTSPEIGSPSTSAIDEHRQYPKPVMDWAEFAPGAKHIWILRKRALKSIKKCTTRTFLKLSYFRAPKRIQETQNWTFQQDWNGSKGQKDIREVQAEFSRIGRVTPDAIVIIHRRFNKRWLNNGYQCAEYPSSLRNENRPDAVLTEISSRHNETIHSGRTQAQRHVVGLKFYPPCPNCNVIQAAPVYILAFIRCYKSQMLSSGLCSFSLFKNAWVQGIEVDVSVIPME
ncbi:hypothetical protein TNCV_2159691 [Trichonephila clavipes]|nr:hypothetical protein TNCV_2159691 [Trichonephila clavipes]